MKMNKQEKEAILIGFLLGPLLAALFIGLLLLA
jgi:hypothetical protein